MNSKFSLLATAALSALLTVGNAQALKADVPGPAPGNREIGYIEHDTDGIPGNERQQTPEAVQAAAQAQIADITEARMEGNQSEAERLSGIFLFKPSLQQPVTAEMFMQRTEQGLDQFPNSTEDFPIYPVSIGVVVDTKLLARPILSGESTESYLERIRPYQEQQQEILNRAANLATFVINRGADFDRDGGLEVPPLALEYGFGGITQIYPIEYDPNATLEIAGQTVDMNVGDIMPRVGDHVPGFDPQTGGLWSIAKEDGSVDNRGMIGVALDLAVQAREGNHTTTLEQRLAGVEVAADKSFANNEHIPGGGTMDP